MLEFGVAGGSGLVSLETISRIVGERLGVDIDVYGFDTGVGLPASDDYRDGPYFRTGGDFPMDPDRLRSRLKRAELILGEVKHTIDRFVQSRPAPIAFIAFDMDYYTSTVDAFALFKTDDSILMPRIYCLFDDVFSCGSFDGERLAIEEFNAASKMRKISQIHGLEFFLPRSVPRMACEKYYMAYLFDHPRFCDHPDPQIRKLDLESQRPQRARSA
jgi:hypothetical protein